MRVIVGANNAGKTNLLDAVHFLGEVHRHGIDIAVSRKGGFENIAHRHKRRTKRPITFEVSATFGLAELKQLRLGRAPRRAARRSLPSERPIRVNHVFALGAASQAIDADFHIREERIQIVRCSGDDRLFETDQLVAEVTRTGQQVSYNIPGEEELDEDSPTSDLISPLEESGFRDFIERSLKPTTLLLTTMGYNEVFYRFGQELSETRLHQLAPIECRKPGVPIPSPELELHGGNLPAVVDYLKKNHKAEWAEVLRSMRAVVPHLTDVKTEYTTDRRLALQFVEEGFGRPWTTEEISDGTVQSLALFCALFDPRSRLTLIEEPENSVHPWIIRNFAEACRRVARKHVYITTHSPVLVDHLQPSEVEVAWRADGRTNLQPLIELDPLADELWSAGKSTVFELLDGGSVQQAVPGEA